MAAYASGTRLHTDAVAALEPVMGIDEMVASRAAVARGVRVDATILAYIQRLVGTTRGHESVQLGAGPRASLALLDPVMTFAPIPLTALVVSAAMYLPGVPDAVLRRVLGGSPAAPRSTTHCRRRR